MEASASNPGMLHARRVWDLPGVSKKDAVVDAGHSLASPEHLLGCESLEHLLGCEWVTWDVMARTGGHRRAWQARQYSKPLAVFKASGGTWWWWHACWPVTNTHLRTHSHTRIHTRIHT